MTVDPYDDHGPFDADELVRWATSYGHPEGWAKKAQSLHSENERLRAQNAIESSAVAERLREDAWKWRNLAGEAAAEVERLQTSLLTVVERVESCCSRSGLCIDADRVRAEAQRPMDKPKPIESLPDSIWNFEDGS